jgi:hypothetical protein
MAFTKQPSQDTYKTVPLPFNGVDLFRSGDLSVPVRDVQIVNAYYDRVSQENQKRTVALKKRPGLDATAYSLTKVTATDPVRGSYNDVVQNAFYWVVLNKLYRLKPDTSPTPSLIATLNTSTGYVGFTSYLKSTGTRYVVLSDGTDIWIHDYVGASCTRVTDGDMPTPHQPYPIYQDGYLYVIKTGTADLYNSNADDPFAWTPGDFITCELNSDLALRPIKAKNYIVVMGYKSIEYFYDAANPSGSPLSRNESPFRAIGYVTGCCDIGDTTYFVGQDNRQNLAVYQLNSFKVERVSNSVVDSTLQAVSASDNAKGQATLAIDGMCISVDGHTFYVVKTPYTTWAFDIEEKFWYEWKQSNGGALAIEAAWAMFNGAQYVAITGQSTISLLSPNVYQDFGVDFTVRYTTDNFNAEGMNWKSCHRVMIIADQHDDSGSSYIDVSYSDKDWADGGTTARQINLFSQSPFLKQWGRFRQRSWRFEYTDNYPLRMSAVLLDLNMGQH